MKWDQTRIFFLKLHFCGVFFFRIKFLSPHSSDCCGYLIESGAFEIVLQAMLIGIGNFVGQLFLNFVNIFLKVSWKINLTVLKLLKSYEEWYATTIFSLNQGLSYNQFNFAWTHFLVIVVIKDIATSITYLKVMATNG